LAAELNMSNHNHTVGLLHCTSYRTPNILDSLTDKQYDVVITINFKYIQSHHAQMQKIKKTFTISHLITNIYHQLSHKYTLKQTKQY